MADRGKFVYSFSEGSGGMKDLLGGKGAGLAEMCRLGLPVPPGFTLTTEACRAYTGVGELPAGLMESVTVESVTEHLRDLEEVTGKRLGDSADPLLVSVRSGAAVSMPGMMDTVLNLVHLQYRFRVVSYSSGHENSNLRTFTFGKGA